MLTAIMHPPPRLRRLSLFLLALAAPAFAAVDPVPADAANAFPLVAQGRAAVLVVSPDAPEVVRIAATDFAADVERVTGVRPEIVPVAPADDARPRVVVAAEPSPELAGRWEAFQLSARAAASGAPATLTVAGSDRRALAYGLYELSRRIGVSPWYWWADVPVTRRDELHLSAGAEPIDQPAVKYRGIFLNDEGWGLVPWASKTHEPEAGNLGPKTYARLFELLLRLRGNALWPAMHPGTTPFHRMPGNAATADRYAIVVGSSHAEPMLRNNVGEWSADKDLYNYLTNRDGVLAYWEERVKERRSGESLFTLGMRGIHDSAIVGPKNQAERIATLKKIFADQRELLARHLGDGDPARVGQIFVPYKEVLDDYNAGLEVPEDAIVVWPDDNFGYIRRFGTAAEQKRSGGLGVYYHLSYLGAPLSWLWFDSLPPALVWSEMTRAFEHGARGLWIGNVGDMKAHELSTEFFLDLAWHADRTSPDAPARHLRAVAARDFGESHTDTIADLWARHQALAFARKPEHLQWHLPLTPYQPTTLTEREIVARLDAYATLARDTENASSSVPAAARDAFFQLVGYPILSAAAANERYFRAELARLQKARGDVAAANAAFDLVDPAARRIEELTSRYNDEIAGGKWRHIVTINGASPRVWTRYQPATAIPPLNSDAQDAVRPPAPDPEPSPLVAPEGARPGDFVERDRVVSIHAGHFTTAADSPAASDQAPDPAATSAGGWRSVPGLGRTGSAVTLLPSTLDIPADPARAPRLSYRFHVSTGGQATARVRLLPSHPIVSGNGLRLALALDEGPPLPLAVASGFDPRSSGWKERVLANATHAELALPAPLSPGWHTLHLVAVDAGVVVDKIVLDLGGLRPSYDGPAETRLPAP